ncbi:MAG: DUF3883 domain-containing protein, partial [Syntrophothermus sp.]
RTYQIPRGQNGMGRSNVWYADKQSKKFFDDIKGYIRSKGKNTHKIKKAKKSKKPGKGGWNSDPLKRQEIERKAVQTAYKHFTSLGYEVRSYEKDNLGWDLQAYLNENKFLRIEVKGLSGSNVMIELTPNEYKNMMKYMDSYRICVVTNASKKPRLWIFSYSPDTSNWEDDDGNVLMVQEIVSARMQIEVS